MSLINEVFGTGEPYLVKREAPVEDDFVGGFFLNRSLRFGRDDVCV